MSGQDLLAGFADGKAPDAMRTIGEVARALNIRQHVLRYWEEQFPMLRSVKRSGGRRYYRPQDIQLIARIDTLVHREGYTLRGARQAIESFDPAEIAEVPVQSKPVTVMPASSDNARLVARLDAIRADLARALQDA